MIVPYALPIRIRPSAPQESARGYWALPRPCTAPAATSWSPCSQSTSPGLRCPPCPRDSTYSSISPPPPTIRSSNARRSRLAYGSRRSRVTRSKIAPRVAYCSATDACTTPHQRRDRQACTHAEGTRLTPARFDQVQRGGGHTGSADGGAELLQRGERPGDGNCWVLHTWLHGCPPMVVSRFALRTNGTGRRGQLGGQPVGLYSRAIVFALRRKTRRLGDRAGETGATPGGGGTGGLDGQLADCPLAGSRESCPVGLCSFVVRARIHPTGGQDEVRAVDLRQARLTRGAV